MFRPPTAAVSVLPSLSVAVPVTVCAEALSPTVTWSLAGDEPSATQLATPDVTSLQLNVTVGALMYQPFEPSGDSGATAPSIVGFVASILKLALTTADSVFPLLSLLAA